MSDRLTAFQALGRGFVNLRANWQLVPVAWFQSLATLVLFVISFLPLLWLGGVGLMDLAQVSGESAELEAELQVLGGRLQELASRLLSGPVIAALLGSLLLMLAAGLVLSFFQAGIYSILAAGERQALPGAPRSWRLFRTFGLRELGGWGGRRMWRYFWLINVIVCAFLVWVLLLLAGVALLAFLGPRWGTGAVVSAGCGGALPLLFLFFALAFWSQLALAEAAEEGQGWRQASARAIHVLGGRLGSVTALFCLGFLLVVAAEVLLLPATLSLESLSGGGRVCSPTCC